MDKINADSRAVRNQTAPTSIVTCVESIDPVAID